MIAGRLREQALIAARGGDAARAVRLFDSAVATAPTDAALWNSYGTMLSGMGLQVEAVQRFDRALAIDPGHAEATINRAIALDRNARPDKALAALRMAEAHLANLPRYWSARAGIEVVLGQRRAAATSYQRCLGLDPTHARAAHGRARMALERSEDDAVSRYDRALALSAGDPQIWLGKALALEEAGEFAEALMILIALAEGVPQWTAAHEALARLRWRTGDRAVFCASYDAAALLPGVELSLFRSWMEMLAGVGRHQEAADIAAAARRRFPGDPMPATWEAAQAGMAGDLVRADRVLAELSHADIFALPHAARQAIRRGDPEKADALLDRYLSHHPADIEAWALRDVCWRLASDDRHLWLHRQDGLVRQMDLGLSSEDLEDCITIVRAAHQRAAVPVGQSVREGTQLNGALFDRTEPAVARLADAVSDMVTDFRSALPAPDHRHPTLRSRNAPLQVVGSWSVRFTGGGRHVEHVHPQGLWSSALHLVVPTDEASAAGWLELGRPPPDLQVDLLPLLTVPPRPGACVLFPSTMFHGTRPFAAGERLTVAFDLAPA